MNHASPRKKSTPIPEISIQPFPSNWSLVIAAESRPAVSRGFPRWGIGRGLRAEPAEPEQLRGLPRWGLSRGLSAGPVELNQALDLLSAANSAQWNERTFYEAQSWLA